MPNKKTSIQRSFIDNSDDTSRKGSSTSVETENLEDKETSSTSITSNSSASNSQIPLSRSSAISAATSPLLALAHRTPLRRPDISPTQQQQQQQRQETTPRQKRKRRKFEEVERYFLCDFPGCGKSYGSLTHLNEHRVRKRHGMRKKSEDVIDVKNFIESKKLEQRIASRQTVILEPLENTSHEQTPHIPTMPPLQPIVTTHPIIPVPQQGYYGTHLPKEPSYSNTAPNLPTILPPPINTTIPPPLPPFSRASIPPVNEDQAPPQLPHMQDFHGLKPPKIVWSQTSAPMVIPNRVDEEEGEDVDTTITRVAKR